MGIAFSNWQAISSMPNHQYWKIHVDFSDQYFIASVKSRLIDEVNYGGISFEDQMNLCSAIIKDICILKKFDVSVDERLSIDLIRLTVSTKAMQICGVNNRLSYFYHWISTSVSDLEFPNKLTVGLDVAPESHYRVRDIFTSKNDVIWKNAFHTIFEWAGMLYYYLRKGGMYQSLAETNFDPLLFVADSAVNKFFHDLDETTAERILEFLGHARFWAGIYRPDAVPTILAILEKAFDSSNISRNVRRTAAFMLSQSIIDSVEKRKLWASKTLEEFFDLLTASQRLELTITTIDHDLDSVPKNLFSAIDSHLSEFKQEFGNDKIALRYNQTRYFHKLFPLLVRFANKGLSRSIIDVMASWYGIPSEQRRYSPTLCSLPIGNKDAIYAFNGWKVIFNQVTDDMYAEFICATNRWLGKRTIVVDNPAFLEIEARYNDDSKKPTDQMIEGFLIEFYKLNELTPHLSAISESSGLFISSYLQHPIQALMLKTIGVTWPIVTSYQEPFPDRKLQKAYLLTVGTNTGKRQIEMLADDLKTRGVKVDKETDKDIIDKSNFQQIYENSDYDLIWIVAHGIFDPQKPDSAALILSADGSTNVTLNEILQMSLPSNKRRLLVMNICSGGDALIAEGPVGVGLAPMLATREQAVISHLWPVRERAVQIFGMLFIEELLKNNDFFSAYTYATQCLQVNLKLLPGLLQEISVLGRQLAKNISSSEDSGEWGGLKQWGTPVFYE